MPDDRHHHLANHDDIDISSRLAYRPPFKPHAVATSCDPAHSSVMKGRRSDPPTGLQPEPSRSC